MGKIGGGRIVVFHDKYIGMEPFWVKPLLKNRISLGEKKSEKDKSNVIQEKILLLYKEDRLFWQQQLPFG